MSGALEATKPKSKADHGRRVPMFLRRKCPQCGVVFIRRNIPGAGRAAYCRGCRQMRNTMYAAGYLGYVCAVAGEA